MDGWFLESIQQAQPAPVETPSPRLLEVEVIALVERSIVLFERLGGLDQRDQLLFKDIVRSNVLTASSGLLLGAPSDEELTLGDAWLEVFQQVLPRSQFCAAGKLVARAYREEFKEEPPRRQQFVDGAPRHVNKLLALLVDRHPQALPRPAGRRLMETATTPTRQLRLRGVLTPGKHYRRWGCTQGRSPLQWHLENVEATITGWSRRHLRL